MATDVQQASTQEGSTESDPHAQTFCEAFQATVAAGPDDVALRSADGAREVTFGQYAEQVKRIAAGLAALGIRRGDTVALMLTNRIEFYPCDTAALHLGATPFSIYNTSSPEQIAYLFSNAENRVVIAEEQFVDAIRAASADPPTIVCLDGAPEGTIGLDELEASGDPAFDFEATWRAVQPDDILTLIYTSGTTGPPKGVQLSHANMLAQCRAVGQVLPIRRGARITSYLPSAHAADRWSSHYNQLAFGLQIVPVPDARQIAQVLPSVRPTVWGGVPRIFEKLVAALQAGLDREPDPERKAAVTRALDTATQTVRLKDAGQPVPEELAAAHAQLDAAVISKIRERIGLDQAEWIICGASPLSRAVHEFLLALGLPIVELYGMSECSCVVTTCSPQEARMGTVGKRIPDTEFKLADDGELLIRGPIVMRGYRHDPARTAEVLSDDGWLASGDIVEIDDEGYVKIVDRKKELIINAAGKNMSPANIEEKLKSASPLIGQAVCIGDNRPYNVALLVLDPDAAASYAAEHGLGEASVEQLAADEGVQQAVAEGVQRANAQLSRVEQIKRHAVLHEEWMPGGEELTPTMKLKRKPINARYADQIQALYAASR
ncbi:MAG TPA: long-chain fatty acid--CoA ligase [Solirubrobacteraceae bacterium]|nr:long-chain fatty acid--CoA ligase [Solirubrobacteraceae bacterium]